MDSTTWYGIVLGPVTTFALILIAVGLLWLARGKVGEFAREAGVKKVGAFGVDLEFADSQAVKAYDKQGLGRPSKEDRASIRDAARFLVPLAAGSRVLWVDDNPGWNAVERSTLVSWGIDVQAVRSTEEAMRELQDPTQRFDLLISDWRRDGEGDSEAKPAGLALRRRMLPTHASFPIIFYFGFVQPETLAERRRKAREVYADGATGSPGELFRWTLLALARAALDQPRPEQLRRRHVSVEDGAAPNETGTSGDA